ncbi:MAG: class I SAM-dependent methyltransferase [Deltaproteobacteria bacterium]|nr:class I SAM-dependent methyltransferase [Deltaproteobacteria bacterium]
MGSEQEQTAIIHLSYCLRRAWDRRISQDYRFWMSDGFENDNAMFETGKRDFEYLTEGLALAEFKGKCALEIGCGVGRLLQQSKNIFESVIAVDISNNAINKAHQLLSDTSNVYFIKNDGYQLEDVSDNSVDFVYSFATLSHISSRMFAGYLMEICRVIKENGICRLQLYLGTESETVEADSLAIRCYDQGCLKRAVRLAGLKVTDVQRFELAETIVTPQGEQIPSIVTLRRQREPLADREEIAAHLRFHPEIQVAAAWDDAPLECQLMMSLGSRLIQEGNLHSALQTYEKIINFYGQYARDAERIIFALRKSLQK